MRMLGILALTALVACDGGDGTTDDDTDLAGGRVQDILALTGDPTAGEPLYATNCASGCHMEDGTGEDGGGYAGTKNLTTSTLSDAETIEAILEGAGIMIGFADRLEDQQVADILAHIDTL